MNSFPRRLILFFLLFAAGPGLARDTMISDAPRWYTGRLYNGTHAVSVNASNLVWKSGAGGTAGAMRVGNGKILVGAVTGPPENLSGVMTALDTSGRLLWRATHPSLRNRVHDLGQPLQSQAFFDGNRAYYVSNRGELMCVDLEGFRNGNDGPFKGEKDHGAEDVDVIWKVDMVADLGVFKRDTDADAGGPTSSPIVIGDLVFVITGHGIPAYGRRADPKPPSFLAVHKQTGEIAWSSNAPGANICFLQPCSPVAARINGADQVIFPGGDGVLYGFEPTTGRLLWALDCNPPESLDRFRVKWDSSRRAEMKCGFLAKPVVNGSMLYVALNESLGSSFRKPLLAIDLAAPDGQPKVVWKFADPSFGGTYTSAAVGQGLVFVTDYQCVLFALDEKTGRECWRAELEDNCYNVYASPVIHEGRVYAGGSEMITVFEAAREKKCLGQYDFEGFYCGTPQFEGDQMFVATGEYVYALRLP